MQQTHAERWPQGKVDQRGGDRGPAAPVDGDATHTFLTFRLGGQMFALSVAPVREILDEQRVAILPEAPPDVVGLIDVRGESVMVMDVSHRLGVIAESASERRIIVLERQGAGRRPVGVLADQVLSVVEVQAHAIEPVEQGHASSGLLQGVARLDGQLVIVLEHLALLGDPLSAGPDPFP